MTTYYPLSNAEGLAAALGFTQSGGQYSGTCPVCQYPKAFTISSKQGKTLFYCHACQASFGEIRQALAALGLLKGVSDTCPPQSRPASQAHNKQANRPDKTAYALSIWQATFPLDNTPAMAYLQSRGIKPPYPEDLHFHPSLYHAPTRQNAPALVALVRTCEGAPKAIQRLYLPTAGNTPPDPSKMTLGSI